MNNRRAVFDLFLISAVGLFVELMFIRWVASEIRVFSFYKNLALIAAFLGLGIGFAVRRKAGLVDWFARYYFPFLGATALIVVWLGRNKTISPMILSHSNAQEAVWALSKWERPALLLEVLLFYAVMLLLFALITVVFIPLGQMTASKFAAFRPLPGYTINIAGSLVGILAFALVSFLSWPPPVWFLIAGVSSLYFIPRDDWRKFALNGALAAVPVLLTLLWPLNAERTLWSPYYRIDIDSRYAEGDPSLLLGYNLSVNQAWHQQALNLAPEFVAANYDADPEHFDAVLAEYDTPYAVAPRLDRVLIVGAGTGNDVSAALRAGAGEITAVEIDPVILRLGRELHPEQPYADTERVLQVNQDARSFFRRDDHHYDLIVFGLLDSHTLFSAASSVRLDNFVYTRESLTEVRSLLADDGVMALSFAIAPDREWVGYRLYRTITDVFGHPPQVYTSGLDNTLFLITLDPADKFVIDNPQVTPREDYTYHADIDPTTDDWPFLYLEGRLIPNTYIAILIGVLLLSFPMVRGALPNFRQLNWHFFFMGTAFFLLETKSITEMALLFGSTWIVNAVVIAAILTMIILANMLVQRFKLVDPRLFYGLLALALLFDYFVPVSSFLGLTPVLRFTLAAVAQAAPLFFAGVIFAITFSQTESIEIALGSNLLGAVLGGMSEYASLVFGIRSLYLLALAFYLLSLVAWLVPAYRAAQGRAGLSATD